MTMTFEHRKNPLHLVRHVLATSWAIWLCLGSFAVGSPAEDEAVPAGPVGMDRQRFIPVDILIDPHGEPLAAYQLELIDKNESIRIVGVEGGENPAFATPPYYDPKALAHHKIIVAAFSTAKDLPTAKSRVTTLHVLQKGTTSPDLHLRLTAAATPARERIDATATFLLGVAK
jgi:hypothetical protein